jgi:quercetin dioxygenase-like cupin family protein
MPFFRFESFASRNLSPHLSTGEGPVIEGQYMYFCRNDKRAGTGSELHYHPNELLIFPLNGKINAVVGKDRRIVSPGTFVHVPPYARHSMKATEDADLSYLYIKDKTWTVVGIAEDEAPPASAPDLAEVQRVHDAGQWAGGTKNREKSQAIIDGVPDCYHPIIEHLDKPRGSGRTVTWIEGDRLAFGFFDVPPGASESLAGEHECFVYLLGGGLDATVGNEQRQTGSGDIVHVPRGVPARWTAGADGARYVVIKAMADLQARLDRTRS